MKPVYWILSGLAAIGLITLAVTSLPDEENKDTDNNKDDEDGKSSKPEFDVDELRRLRREVRKQSKLKKMAARPQGPVNTSTKKT